MVVVVFSQNTVLFIATESISFEIGKSLRICHTLLSLCTEEHSFYSSVMKLTQVDKVFLFELKKKSYKNQGGFHMKLYTAN